MPNLVYDTRFFIEHYYSADHAVQEKTKRELLTVRNKYVSVITLHEVYRFSLAREGREIAQLRVDLISNDFDVVDVDSAIAVKAAEMRHGLSLPMADSLIAATCSVLKATCVTDDPHFTRVRELTTRWI
jgi:predicted nucleic acid-binding protein